MSGKKTGAIKKRALPEESPLTGGFQEIYTLGTLRRNMMGTS